MTDAKSIILEYVCPSLGTIVGVYMFYAPFQDVQKALARGSLGDLNPLPWAFTLGNCCGWVFYSILINNLFVFFPNMIGFLFAVWFNLAATKLLYTQQFTALPQQQHDNNKRQTSQQQPQQTHAAPSYDYCVMAVVLIWASIIALVGFGLALSLETKQWIVGGASNLNLLFFYGAPLSTIATVLRTRNTASIHFLTMVTNTANGCFWAAYGFAIMDFLIFVPNGLGALLGFVQLALYVTFPRVMSTDDDQQQEEEAVVVDEESIPTAKDQEDAQDASGLTAREDIMSPDLSEATLEMSPPHIPASTE
ncbi:Bidirectional sugar transporter SWEET2a [Seminavis robusta]|uniref:Bidirectional sugar transporter SWEET2a n=1 Tax=Seminavis robusta TaxID=568900 RepID=A0A9N8HHY5_9STRA|nr:Bidirectional sugar transporter SWEET2a [Seminavis robusta]|eukprot:Sro741_g195720.1 Bidirectional sugar transporter SWEET2a (307) ;mRNA; r:22594-23621